jgi:hypothetical protein
MCSHWSNRQHLDQAKARFAPGHRFVYALGNLLLNGPFDNAGMLRLCRLQRHHILIALFKRTAK